MDGLIGNWFTGPTAALFGPVLAHRSRFLPTPRRSGYWGAPAEPATSRLVSV